METLSRLVNRPQPGTDAGTCYLCGEETRAGHRRAPSEKFTAWAVEKESLPLTEGEFLLTAAACNGLIWEPPEVAVRMIWAQVDDYLRLDGLVPEGVDGEALVEKLQNFTPAQLLILSIRVRRFWARKAFAQPAPAS